MIKSINIKVRNAQQYPKDITKIVSPRPGYVMIDADYSQIEYRVLTALANNVGLAELFKNPDSDYHTLMASLMFEVPYAQVTKQMRSQAKSFNFGIPYGMGPGSLAILLTGRNTKQTRDEAIEKTEQYFKNQPNTRKFFDNVKEMAQVNRYTKTQFNRYRYYSFTDKDGNVNNAKKAAALRQAGNAVIQGCLDGNTRIQTKEFGIMKIKDLVGYSGEVWDGYKWSHGDVLYSGEKRKCIIRFKNGQKFICSPIHKFLPCGLSADVEDNYIECQNLKPGTIVEINWNSDLCVDIPDEVEKKFEDFCSSINADYDETCIDSPLFFLDMEVESVEITDEYIDMYDVCNTDGGYYVADGIITHNTAADIFKISVARNFSYIRRNRLFGDFLIINMVHDEQLMEINVNKLNIQRIARDVMYNMQYDLDGYPPLFIGAGVGLNWAFAKGGDAEMHPNLLKQLADEADNMPIRKEVETETDVNDVLAYFQARIKKFSREKIAAYLMDPANQGTDMHPAIVALLNDKFNVGTKDMSPDELTRFNLEHFIDENQLPVSISLFLSGNAEAAEKDVEEDEEYDEDDEDELTEEEYEKQFTLIDESDKLFGASVQDLIATFGVCLLKQQKICGVDTRNIYYKVKDSVVDYLTAHVCDWEDPDGLEISFLTDANVLNRTGIKVKNVKATEIEKRLKGK